MTFLCFILYIFITCQNACFDFSDVLTKSRRCFLRFLFKDGIVAKKQLKNPEKYYIIQCVEVYQKCVIRKEWT